MSIFSKLKRSKQDEPVEDKKTAELDVEKKIEEKKPTSKETETKKVAKKEEKQPVKKISQSKIDKIDKKDAKPYLFAHHVLIRPLVTEKVNYQGQYNQYSFEVARSTNKVEIQKAIQSVYGVKPISVNVINIQGKKVRYGRRTGKTKAWKKAVVTLKQGDKIEVYEGV